MTGVKVIESADDLTVDELKTGLDRAGIPYKKSGEKKTYYADLYSPYFEPTTKMDWMDTSMNVVLQMALDILGVKRREEPEHQPLSCAWGNDWERHAIERYQEETFYKVDKAEFAVHPKLDFVGGTADGLVGVKGLIEVKNPYNQLKHYFNITDNAFVRDYNWQTYGYMAVYDREWTDLISHDAGYPKPFDLHIVPLKRENHQRQIDILEKRLVAAFEKANELACELMKKKKIWA